MEEMDDLSFVFAGLPKYQSPQIRKDFLQKLLNSDSMSIIRAEV
jgi:hypothetical protein